MEKIIEAPEMPSSLVSLFDVFTGSAYASEVEVGLNNAPISLKPDVNQFDAARTSLYRLPAFGDFVQENNLDTPQVNIFLDVVSPYTSFEDEGLVIHMAYQIKAYFISNSNILVRNIIDRICLILLCFY